MITYTKFVGKYCIKGTMIDDLDAVIAAAVQAEREACAKVADRPELYGCNIAAFIRARGNGSAAEPPALFDDKISDEEADMLDAEQEEEAAEFLGIKPDKPKRSKRTNK